MGHPPRMARRNAEGCDDSIQKLDKIVENLSKFLEDISPLSAQCVVLRGKVVGLCCLCCCIKYKSFVFLFFKNNLNNSSVGERTA